MDTLIQQSERGSQSSDMEKIVDIISEREDSGIIGILK